MKVQLKVEIDVPNVKPESKGALAMVGTLEMAVLYVVTEHVQKINLDAGTIVLGEVGVSVKGMSQ